MHQLRNLYRAVRGWITDRFDPYVSFPRDVAAIDIGQSREGRPVRAYVCGTGQTNVLLTSGIHGNEVGTVKLARRTVRWLSDNPAAAQQLTVYVVPCLNPDGFARAKQRPDFLHGGAVGRFNATDVDLNRNFDTPSFVSQATWSYGKGYAQSRPVFAGEAALSEPETRNIAEFIKQRGIKVWFSFHNAGSDVMSSTGPLAVDLASLFAHASGFSLFADSKWRRLQQTGTPKEWCELQGVAYVEVEGASRWGSDWPRLKPALAACLAHVGEV